MEPRLSELTHAMKSHANRYTAGRFLQAHAMGNGDLNSAAVYAEHQHHWLDQRQIVQALKTAVTSMGTGDYPAALVPVADSFLAAMRSYSIPLQLAGLRRAPMCSSTKDCR